MGWICVGIVSVLFTILGNTSAQQGYSYPTPQKPFPGVPTSGVKPSDTQKPFGTQTQGSYPGQQDSSTPSVGYPGIKRPTGVRESSNGFLGHQDGSTPTSAPVGSSNIQPSSGVQRPAGSFPGQQELSNPSPSYPGTGTPQQSSGAQKPFGSFSGSTSAAGASQQGYSYPTPGKPFVGGFANGRTEAPSTSPSPGTGSQRPSGSYPEQQGPSRPFVSSGTSSATVPSGGQPFGGYPTTEQPVGGSLVSSPGQPGPARPFGPSTTGTPIGGQTPSGYSDSRPEGRPSVSYPGQQGPSRPFGSSGTASVIPSGGQPFGGYPATEKPVGRPSVSYPGQQGPARPFGPSTTGTQLGGQAPSGYSDSRPEERPSVSYPGQQGPSRPFGSLDTIPSSAPAGGQSFNGYPAAGRPGGIKFPSSDTYRPSVPSNGQGQYTSKPQLPITGVDSSRPLETSSQPNGNGYSSTAKPIGPQFPSGTPQFPSKPYPGSGVQAGGQQVPTQQGVNGYTNTNKPTGQQLPFGESQTSFKPASAYPSPGAQQVFEQHGTPSSERPQSYPSTGGIKKPSGSISNYPSPGASSQGQQITGSQGAYGYPGSSRPTTPASGLQKPFGHVAPSGGVPQIPGQQDSNEYPSQGRPTGSQVATGGIQGPLSGYLPPGQGTGGLPLSDRPGGAQYPAEPFPLSEDRKPAGIFSGSSNIGRPTGRPQTGYGTPSGPSSGNGKPTSPQFSSSQSQRPNGYPGSPPAEYGTPSTAQGRPLPSSPQSTFGSQGASGTNEFQGSFPSQQGFVQQVHPGDEVNEEQFEGDYSAIPGEPETDYPILRFVPETSFRCDEQKYRGYYADVETRCQAFHICANNKTYDFLCPNGTIFHQEHLVCVWWNNFDCNSAPSLYDVNENIYDLSITGIQQTGGIPVPGQDFPPRQNPEEYPGEGVPGFPLGTSSGRYPNAGTQTGVASQKPSGYPGGETQRPEIAPQVSGVSGYQTGRPQGDSFPSTPSRQPISDGFKGFPEKPLGHGLPSSSTSSSGSQIPVTTSQGTSSYPSGVSQGFGAVSHRPEGYPSLRPQGPSFPVTSQQPDISSNYSPFSGTQTPGATPQSPETIQRPTVPVSQTPNGFLNGVAREPGTESQKPEGYPKVRPQGPSFPSGFGNGYRGPTGSSSGVTPQTPEIESQRPGEYFKPQTPSFPLGPGAQVTSGYPSGGAQRPADRPQTPEGYPSGRPQGSSFPSGVTQGPLIGSQRPEEHPNERPQTPSFPLRPGSKTPSESVTEQGSANGYPSVAAQAPGSGSQKPEGYPSGKPQGPSFPSSANGHVSQGETPVTFPSRPGTPFSGSLKPHQPSREYLPLRNRK